MFSEYFAEVQTAIDNADRKISEYGKIRERLALDVKAKIETESESITKSSELKNYSPIQHHNEMTVLIHSFEKMKTEEASELNKIKELLHANLIRLMKIPEPKAPDPPITEMYKIIGQSSQNNNYICRVWFTLIPIPKWGCVPGDPVRVEWVQVNHNISRNNDLTDNITKSPRTGKGPDGLKIPQFDQAGRVTNATSFYNITQWGATSNQRTWWEQWIAANRPL